MDRENKRGDKSSWQLLYIADPDYMVKPPFFIQWNDSDEYREEQFKKFYQLTFTIETVIISSEKRRDTVENWKKWYDMKEISQTDGYTDLTLANDDICFRIEDGKESDYQSIILKDSQTTAPYSVYIRGAKYRFEPNYS